MARHRSFHPSRPPAAQHPKTPLSIDRSTTGPEPHRHIPVKEHHSSDSKRLQSARPHFGSGETALAQLNRYAFCSLVPVSHPLSNPPCQGCGSCQGATPSHLLRTRLRRLLGDDTSYQSLQPSCCHEYPPEYPTPKFGAFTRPTATTDSECRPMLMHRLFLEVVGGDAD